MNAGADVTKGLKKVDKDQMTHKNPSLRASGVVPHKVTNTYFTAKLCRYIHFVFCYYAYCIFSIFLLFIYKYVHTTKNMDLFIYRNFYFDFSP